MFTNPVQALAVPRRQPGRVTQGLSAGRGGLVCQHQQLDCTSLCALTRIPDQINISAIYLLLIDRFHAACSHSFIEITEGLYVHVLGQSWKVIFQNLRAASSEQDTGPFSGLGSRCYHLCSMGQNSLCLEVGKSFKSETAEYARSPAWLFTKFHGVSCSVVSFSHFDFL